VVDPHHRRRRRDAQQLRPRRPLRVGARHYFSKPPWKRADLMTLWSIDAVYTVSDFVCTVFIWLSVSVQNTLCAFCAGCSRHAARCQELHLWLCHRPPLRRCVPDCCSL
jgi:hypothetical protein